MLGVAILSFVVYGRLHFLDFGKNESVLYCILLWYINIHFPAPTQNCLYYCAFLPHIRRNAVFIYGAYLAVDYTIQSVKPKGAKIEHH